MPNTDRVKLIIQCFHSASQVRFQVSDKAPEKANNKLCGCMWVCVKVFFSTVKAGGERKKKKEKKILCISSTSFSEKASQVLEHIWPNGFC